VTSKLGKGTKFAISLKTKCIYQNVKLVASFKKSKSAEQRLNISNNYCFLKQVGGELKITIRQGRDHSSSSDEVSQVNKEAS